MTTYDEAVQELRIATYRMDAATRGVDRAAATGDPEQIQQAEARWTETGKAYMAAVDAVAALRQHVS